MQICSLYPTEKGKHSYEDVTDSSKTNNAQQNTTGVQVENNEISTFNDSFILDICYIPEIRDIKGLNKYLLL